VALFLDALKGWDEQRRSTEALADLVCRATELDGTPPARPLGDDAVSARAAECAPTRVDALRTVH
jgi:hypothetical protein